MRQENRFPHPDGSGRRIPKGDYMSVVQSHATVDRIVSMIDLAEDCNIPVLDHGP